MAEGFKGKLNIYTCGTCRGHVVTKDLDEGVTPFMMECRATAGCRGDMRSSMYRVYDQEMRPDFEWYRPTAVEVVEPPLRDHVSRGGLLIRPARRAA
ncbi:hypothetical protein [Methylobacterium sp. SD21]|uniref:hypothetical protein n=1 Tax=Methylobacterium litchii TaxID=3138810 RepID=UPI00313C8E65